MVQNSPEEVMKKITDDIRQLGESDPELKGSTKKGLISGGAFEGTDALLFKLEEAKMSGSKKHIENMAQGLMSKNPDMNLDQAKQQAAKNLINVDKAQQVGRSVMGVTSEKIETKLANTQVYEMISALLARFAESQQIKQTKDKPNYEAELSKPNPGRNNRLAIAIVKLINEADQALKGQPGYKEFQGSDKNAQALFEVLKLKGFRAQAATGPLAKPPTDAPPVNAAPTLESPKTKAPPPLPQRPGVSQTGLFGKQTEHSQEAAAAKRTPPPLPPGVGTGPKKP
jgi:hypothetical protein